MNAMQQTTSTASTDSSHLGHEANEPETLDMSDIVGDATHEELGMEEPVETTVAATIDAPVETAAAGAAEDEGDDEDEIDLDNIPEPVQREDGKWVLADKYVADTPLGLVKEVEKARRHAEATLKNKQHTKADPAANPFLESEEEFDEEFDEDEELEVFDELDFGSQVGAGVAQALMQYGLVPQQQQPDIMAQQASVVARQAINNPDTTPEEFELMLEALVTHNLTDTKTRKELVNAWASLGGENTVKAVRADIEIDQAIDQVMQQQAYAQQSEQQAALEQQQIVEAEERDAQATVPQQAYEAATAAWCERNTDWVAGNQLDQDMNEWMARNPVSVSKAQGDAAAIFELFNQAKEYAVLKGQVRVEMGAGAGVSGGAAESAATVSPVIPPTQQFDAAAIQRAANAEMRDAASMETGVTDDVAVHITGSNPSGLTETPVEDVLGMEIA